MSEERRESAIGQEARRERVYRFSTGAAWKEGRSIRNSEEFMRGNLLSNANPCVDYAKRVLLPPRGSLQLVAGQLLPTQPLPAEHLPAQFLPVQPLPAELLPAQPLPVHPLPSRCDSPRRILAHSGSGLCPNPSHSSQPILTHFLSFFREPLFLPRRL